MLYGYLPQGLINEELYASKPCSQTQGYAIGMLCVDNIWYSVPPGCGYNASTYDFPVLMRVMHGISDWEVLTKGGKEQFAPEVRDLVIREAKELEKSGVRAIAGGCGFLVNFQKDVAAAVDIPVFLSALCLIPVIRLSLKPKQKIGIVTAGSDLLGQKNFEAIGVSDISDLVILGLENANEFAKIRANTSVGHYNPAKLDREVAESTKQFVQDNPDIGAILFECTALPQFAWSVQNAVNLPVYDIYTLICWMHKSVVRFPFGGIY